MWNQSEALRNFTYLERVVGALHRYLADVLKGKPLIQRVFNKNTIPQREMLLVARNIFTHKISFPCCQKEL